MVTFHVKHVTHRGARASLRARLADAADPRPVSTSLVHGATIVECDPRDARLVLREIVRDAKRAQDARNRG